MLDPEAVFEKNTIPNTCHEVNCCRYFTPDSPDHLGMVGAGLELEKRTETAGDGGKVQSFILPGPVYASPALILTSCAWLHFLDGLLWG